MQLINISDGAKQEQQTKCLKVVKEAAETSQLHCDYNPEKPKPQPELHKRVIDGRLWGSSSELSNIKIDIEEGEAKVKELDLLDHEEQIFFRQNPDIYNLGKRLISQRKRRPVKKTKEPEQYYASQMKT